MHLDTYRIFIFWRDAHHSLVPVRKVPDHTCLLGMGRWLGPWYCEPSSELLIKLNVHLTLHFFDGDQKIEGKTDRQIDNLSHK